MENDTIEVPTRDGSFRTLPVPEKEILAGADFGENAVHSDALQAIAHDDEQAKGALVDKARLGDD